MLPVKVIADAADRKISFTNGLWLMQPLRNQLLVDELQLGGQLNQCVRNAQPATFGLLLAMLSQDMCDQPRFDAAQASGRATEEELRRRLQLPPRPLARSAGEYCTQAVHLSRLLEQGLRTSVASAVSLIPEPLASRDNKLALDDRVRTNISALGQAKLASSPSDGGGFEPESPMDEIGSTASVRPGRGRLSRQGTNHGD